MSTALPWAAATQLDLHLHTADPGEAGISTTNEATYTGYAAVTVSRAGSAWTVSGNTASNARTPSTPPMTPRCCLPRTCGRTPTAPCPTPVRALTGGTG